MRPEPRTASRRSDADIESDVCATQTVVTVSGSAFSPKEECLEPAEHCRHGSCGFPSQRHNPSRTLARAGRAPREWRAIQDSREGSVRMNSQRRGQELPTACVPRFCPHPVARRRAEARWRSRTTWPRALRKAFTTPAFEPPARRRSDGRGSAEAADAGGITPQSKRRWKGWAFRLSSVPCAHRGRRWWSLRQRQEFEISTGMQSAILRSASGHGNARCHTGIRPGQSPVWRFGWLCEGGAQAPVTAPPNSPSATPARLAPGWPANSCR